MKKLSSGIAVTNEVSTSDNITKDALCSVISSSSASVIYVNGVYLFFNSFPLPGYEGSGDYGTNELLISLSFSLVPLLDQAEEKPTNEFIPVKLSRTANDSMRTSIESLQLRREGSITGVNN